MMVLQNLAIVKSDVFLGRPPERGLDKYSERDIWMISMAPPGLKHKLTKLRHRRGATVYQASGKILGLTNRNG